MSREGMPSIEPPKIDIDKGKKLESAKTSQEGVDAEQFKAQFDARMDGIDVSVITDTIKKIEADLENVPEGDAKRYEDLNDLKELVSNLQKMKQAPSLKDSILSKMAKTQIFDITRMSKVPGLDPKIKTALEGLSNAAYHIAQSKFPDQFNSQRVAEDKRNSENINATRDRLMKMKVS